MRDDIVTHNGFRLRGREMTRIETFTDAAFAFALTLLVVSLNPPSSYTELTAALRDVPAFLLSATLLMVFWWGHHEWSRRFGLDDGPAVLLSCGLVFTVLVYVYPLRFMFGLMMSWIGAVNGLPIGSADLSFAAVVDVNSLFAIYGFGFIAMSLALVLLNVHAWRQRGRLELNDVEQHVLRTEIGSWLILAVVGAISVMLALLVPAGWVGMPGWAYMLLPVTMPLYSSISKRRFARQQAAQLNPPVK